MGKEGDLWDDSALINAFDSAMSKYKKMLKIECDGPSGEGKDVSRTIEDTSYAVEENNKNARELDENNKAVSSAETKVAEASYLSPDKEKYSEDLHAPDTFVDSSNGAVGAPEGYSYSYGADDYNQLLSQYYEIEEKRQIVIQQLNQFGSWNYQPSGEGSVSAAQWGTCLASQDCTVPNCQASHPTIVCSCCPYASQCIAPPCTSLLGGTSGCQTCSDNSAAKGPGKSVVEDSNMVKTAMEAAERAISSMNMKKDVHDHVKEVQGNERELAQSTSSETDLNDVLRAWYSAGFYTGKYLGEQSMAKKSHK